MRMEALGALFLSLVILGQTTARKRSKCKSVGNSIPGTGNLVSLAKEMRT